MPRNLALPFPKWADWHPQQFDDSCDGIRHQKLGWKAVDFGLDKFDECGLVLLSLTAPLVDEYGEPLTTAQRVGGFDYPVTGFSRKYLFVQAGQTEPHHFHRQKKRKEVRVVAGAACSL